MADASSPESPMSGWERAFLVFAVLVQQAAFIPLPDQLLGLESPLDALGNSIDPARSNPSNVVLMLACLVTLGILSLSRLRPLIGTIKQNPLIVVTTALVVASVLWSFDPILSMRRAGTYSVGVLLALYLVSRLRFDDIVKLLAVSTLLPAIGSLLYAIALPGYAYMQTPDLADSLRGVFSHKNQLANVMAIGFLLRVYLALTTPRWRSHLAFAVLHAGLVVMAHSASFTMSLGLFAVLLAFHRLARVNRQVAAMAGVAGVVLVIGLGAAALQDPEGFFGLLGRDPTMTGRAELWPKLPAIIAQHPWLGWGYAAFWQKDNDVVAALWADLGWQPPHAHNGFFEVTIDFGLVGLALALLMLARFARNALRAGVGYDAWVYRGIVAYTLFNNLVEISLLRGQEFAWFAFLAFYMTSAARQAAPTAVEVAPPAASVLARAKPLPRPKSGIAS
jgi:O-antigen ligase